MKKRILVAMLAGAMCFSAMPVMNVDAKTCAQIYDDEEETEGEAEEPSALDAGELLAEDVIVSPSKKTIKVGKSFHVSIVAKVGSDYDDMPDEEWDEVIENNVDTIEAKSAKTAVASVKTTDDGDIIITGRKKGNTKVTIKVYLANGQIATRQVKVYVTK